MSRFDLIITQDIVIAPWHYQPYFDRESYIETIVANLRARGDYPHFHVNNQRDGGCAVCGVGPGALQHNYYLIRDWQFLQFMER